MAGLQNKISIIDFKTLRIVKEIIQHKYQVQNVLFSKNSKNLISSDEKGTLALTDIENPKFKQYLLGYKDPIQALSFSKDE